jgi:hypothetical protein
MVAMSSLVQVNIGVAAVSIAYCFYEAKKLQVFSSLVSPSTMLNQPANLRLAVAVAGGSTLFLGLSLLERAFFRDDSTGKINYRSTYRFILCLIFYAVLRTCFHIFKHEWKSCNFLHFQTFRVTVPCYALFFKLVCC